MGERADRFYMRLALEEAAKGLGRTSPNPAVGCVVARDGVILGRGHHAYAGGPHAEVVVLEGLEEAAAGADLYVTLEPCSHHGRTPPCADLIISSGIKRVVVGMLDPNPEVSGAGIGRLRKAGIEVIEGVEEERSRRLNEGFIHSITTGRAFVHLKMAATLDGKIGTATGDSRWITSTEARHLGHEMRDRCNVVMIGVGTALADDPRLNVRLEGKPARSTLRVVFDRRLRISTDLGMFSPEEAGDNLVVCEESVADYLVDRIQKTGAEVLKVGSDDAGLDLEAVMAELYRRGYMEALLEGGGRTARAFLDSGLVGRVHLFFAPKLLGGDDAVAMIGGTSPGRIDQSVALEEVEVEMVGPDIYVTAVPGAG